MYLFGINGFKRLVEAKKMFDLNFPQYSINKFIISRAILFSRAINNIFILF